MAAPCILRLDKSISEASSELERMHLLAEKACYLARVGEFVEAESIRSQLRQSFGDNRDLKASVLVMVLEALQDFYQVLGGDAEDRLMRAQLLSRAARNRELTALTSAWLGHIRLCQGQIHKSIDDIAVAIDSIEPKQWAAVWRISTVLADIFLTVGSPEAARRWYTHARHAAFNYGDQAALGAITYNQAALRLFYLRLNDAIGLPVDEAALGLAAAECKSALNFQVVAGVKSLDHLLTGVMVGVAMLRSEHVDALSLLTKLLQAGEVPEDYPYRLVLLADAVLCCVKLNLPSDAMQHLAKLMESNPNELPLDDQLVVFSNLNRAHQLAPDLLSGMYQPRALTDMAETLSAQRTALHSALRPFEEVPESLKW